MRALEGLMVGMEGRYNQNTLCKCMGISKIKKKLNEVECTFVYVLLLLINE